jgi:hypothetical protein
MMRRTLPRIDPVGTIQSRAGDKLRRTRYDFVDMSVACCGGSGGAVDQGIRALRWARERSNGDSAAER